MVCFSEYFFSSVFQSNLFLCLVFRGKCFGIGIVRGGEYFAGVLADGLQGPVDDTHAKVHMGMGAVVWRIWHKMKGTELRRRHEAKRVRVVKESEEKLQ